MQRSARGAAALPAATWPGARRFIVLDCALAGLLMVWAVVGLLPVGVWTGVGSKPAYGRDIAFEVWGVVVTALITLLLLAVTRGRSAAWLRAALQRALALHRTAYLFGLGLLASAEAVAVAVLCFARNPQLIDTWAQYLQARFFAAGSLAGAPPPALQHFAILQMVTTPSAWFSQYPPIHPLLLAAGLSLGVPWLITPLLAGLLPAAVYGLGRQGNDERVARLAAALVVLSPFAIAMNASGMNHLPAALCVAAALTLTPALSRGSAGAACAFGLLCGLTVGIRPLDALALTVVGAAALLPPIAHRHWRPAAAAACGGVLGALPTVVFNAATTGSPVTFGYTALYGAAHGLGFHAGPWGEPLTPLRALGLTAGDAHDLDTYLLEWPLPVTLLIVAAIADRRGLDGGRRAAAAYLAVLVGLLFFYFHRDLLYGPRFLFSALPAILVLVAAGVVRLAAVEWPLPRLPARLGDAVVVGIAVLAVQSALWLAPQRLASYSAANTVLALHPDDDARRAGLHHAVIVLRDGLGTRLIARLWAAGIPVAWSARLYAAFDACTLDELLQRAEAEGTRGVALLARLQGAAASASPGRYAPGVTRDPLLRLPESGPLPAACATAIEWDRAGTMQYAAVAYLNTPRFDGDLVWARELPDLSALRRLYPDRPIYRYAQPAPGAPPIFTRID